LTSPNIINNSILITVQHFITVYENIALCYLQLLSHNFHKTVADFNQALLPVYNRPVLLTLIITIIRNEISFISKQPVSELQIIVLVKCPISNQQTPAAGERNIPNKESNNLKMENNYQNSMVFVETPQYQRFTWRVNL